MGTGIDTIIGTSRVLVELYIQDIGEGIQVNNTYKH